MFHLYMALICVHSGFSCLLGGHLCGFLHKLKDLVPVDSVKTVSNVIVITCKCCVTKVLKNGFEINLCFEAIYKSHEVLEIGSF